MTAQTATGSGMGPPMQQSGTAVVIADGGKLTKVAYRLELELRECGRTVWRAGELRVLFAELILDACPELAVRTPALVWRWLPRSHAGQWPAAEAGWQRRYGTRQPSSRPS
jgi:hypothetical protein